MFDANAAGSEPTYSAKRMVGNGCPGAGLGEGLLTCGNCPTLPSGGCMRMSRSRTGTGTGTCGACGPGCQLTLFGSSDHGLESCWPVGA